MFLYVCKISGSYEESMFITIRLLQWIHFQDAMWSFFYIFYDWEDLRNRNSPRFDFHGGGNGSHKRSSSSDFLDIQMHLIHVYFVLLKSSSSVWLRRLSWMPSHKPEEEFFTRKPLLPWWRWRLGARGGVVCVQVWIFVTHYPEVSQSPAKPWV